MFNVALKERKKERKEERKKDRKKPQFRSLYTVFMLIEAKVVNYNFECDWLIKLSDNKPSDNNLASELEENGVF